MFAMLIDPSVVPLLNIIVTGLVAVAVAAIGAKQYTNHQDLASKVGALVTNTDGMQTALTEALKGKGDAQQGQANAEGQLQGRADARTEAKEDSLTVLPLASGASGATIIKL